MRCTCSPATFQLWRGFRNRNLKRHRGIGRVALVAGLTSGVFGDLFGFFLSFGGTLQASASVVFGAWFVTALIVAYRAVRRRDITTHRRWMIRAFAVGLAERDHPHLSGIFEGIGVLETDDAFGVAFWISFLLKAAIALSLFSSQPDGSGAEARAARPPDRVTAALAPITLHVLPNNEWHSRG